MTAAGLLREIEDVGRDPRRGGYSRHVFDAAESQLRDWFVEQAARAGLDTETDRNGNIWAWWGAPGPDAVVTGSHLDSVPGGGAFDGPLGVASALAAVESLRGREFVPRKPLAVVAFAEEEGGRFGVACLGSRLLTGAIAAEDALALRDASGISLAEAATRAGLEPRRFGPDPETLGRIGRFVELHVEQGKGLVKLDAPVGVGTSVLEHGRWRFSFSGQGNHAGATPLADRRDPMLPSGARVSAARRVAERFGDARATVGRLVPTPGGANVIASTVDLWLDARVPRDAHVQSLVDEVAAVATQAAAAEGCTVRITQESYSPAVTFDIALKDELSSILGGVPGLSTGAGHDAAILAAHVPAGMLHVRNPTGVSHAPEEFAEDADVDHGADALARVLERLST
jgi:N-carbamoyl-L-amino-acid hydrolase